MHLNGTKIFLRTVLPSDTDNLHQWENDRSIWPVSGTTKLFTKKEIEDFISDSQKDIYSTQQLRFMIILSESPDKKTEYPVGCIDLFDFDEQHRRAGVGVLIAEEKERNKGYAPEALKLLIRYSFEKLFLRELYCTIHSNNTDSLQLFLRNKFTITEKLSENKYFLQLLNK